ncbi:SgcJ/EcaC family oxidoreductase [Mucilaginibacter terrae]|uniref:SgcJ/EcaC family oxidoreductase n=1 Tax=Mucilaginibacter terrae TaxID=1955052 RepID=UPI003635E88D
MKTTIILLAAVLCSFTTLAQNRKADAQAIEKQVDAMVTSWNNHDHSDMKNYTTVDCDWVNIVGMWWKNRKEVEFSTQFYHDRMFKKTPMQKKGVAVRFVSPTVALVHFTSHVGSFVTPDGHQLPAADDLALLVYVKQNGKWLMTAGENVVIDLVAQKNNPVNFMPK